MSKKYIPWQLYADNFDLACKWIEEGLERNGLTYHLGHQALNLGMTEKVNSLIKTIDKNEKALIGSLKFRISRRYEEQNPYRYLYDPGLYEIIDEEVSSSIKLSTLQVALNGGLGDQLEALSFLIPYIRNKNLMLEVQFSEKYRDIFSQILPQIQNIRITNEDGINYSAVRYWIANTGYNNKYSSWINFNIDLIKPSGQTFCWKAAIGTDKFSAHIRSVPFDQVIKLYKRILKNNPKQIITDISSWNKYESIILKSLGIRLYSPEQGKLEELFKLINNTTVSTIDTALAHLCSSLGKSFYMLIPKCPDDRWIQLRKKTNSYFKYCTFIQQKSYFCWKEPMEELFQILKSN